MSQKNINFALLESVLNFIERVCSLQQKIVSASLRLFSATFHL